MVPKFNRKTEIEITYDPYRMETTIKKNGRDIKDDGNFKKCKKFIDEKIPWLTPPSLVLKQCTISGNCSKEG